MDWMRENPGKFGVLVGVFVILVSCGAYQVSEKTAVATVSFTLLSFFVAFLVSQTEGERSWDTHLHYWRVSYEPGQLWTKNFSNGYIAGLFLTTMVVGAITHFLK